MENAFAHIQKLTAEIKEIAAENKRFLAENNLQDTWQVNQHERRRERLKAIKSELEGLMNRN